MSVEEKAVYPWAIIGAGPAGLASAGLLLDSGVNSKDILIIDPEFHAGDFGRHWGQVHSNTSVELFLKFFADIKGFDLEDKLLQFRLASMPHKGYCQLKEVSEILLSITNKFRTLLSLTQGYVKNLAVDHGVWQLDVDQRQYQAEKVILATGSDPKSLSHKETVEISLYDALNPPKLRYLINKGDSVAVFGSSHSSMIIMKNLLDLGVNSIINFYLSAPRYAIKMDGWTLYDNTGLKADTAKWAHDNISQKLDPRIQRYISNPENIDRHMPACNKAVYPIGFKARFPEVSGVDVSKYDVNTGIIAPGLFGAGIAFPRKIVNPLGGVEFNVGLYKFMNDIRRVIPIWLKYGL